LDEVEFGKLPQVVARGATGFIEELGQAAGSLRPITGQHLENLNAQRVRERFEGRRIDLADGEFLLWGLVHVGNDTLAKKPLQAFLCKSIFANLAMRD
jgi:hypothetical protein